jgi:hypothetical protein
MAFILPPLSERFYGFRGLFVFTHPSTHTTRDLRGAVVSRRTMRRALDRHRVRC